jgi:hypothetical protein
MGVDDSLDYTYDEMGYVSVIYLVAVRSVTKLR